MQRKVSLLALGISVVAALLLVWMLGRGPLGATRSVVVITRDLAAGEAITRAMLDTRDLPEAYVEERHIPADDVERVIGTRVAAHVASGASLLWSDLDVRPSRELSGLVQVGRRAVSLPMIGAESWLHAGDRVDLLFTPNVPEDGSPDDQPSVVLLENTLVIAVEDKGAVTVSVPPREALRIAHTKGRGALQVALRNTHDVAMAEVFEDSRGAP